MFSEKNILNKNEAINLMKKPIDELIINYEKGKNEDLLNWIVIKLNILLKNQFHWDLYIEKNKRIEWKLTTRTYDIVIQSHSYGKALLVISLNKLFNNLNKNFFLSYKDIILWAMNLWIDWIPYYNLTISPIKNLNSTWQFEVFSKKNLYRIFNWNNANIIPWINKLLLYNWHSKTNNFTILQDLDVIFWENSKTSYKIGNSILIPDMKDFFLDVYNILKKYL